MVPARFVEAPYLFERWRCTVGSMGFIFGLLGFVFVLSAMEKIRRLEQRLKDAGGLKETNDSG